jgi:UDP-N-acetylglucosamine acyltransferase
MTGEHSHIHPTAVINDDPEVPRGWDRRDPERRYGPKPSGRVTIGQRTVVRAFVTIDAPSVEAWTSVGADCFLHRGCHVGHDAQIGNDVTIGPNAMVGGHCIIQDRGYLGMGCMLHQHVIIGELAMVGMGAVVLGDVPPFATVVGNPARIVGVNHVGMERAGMSEEEMREAHEAVRAVTFAAGFSDRIRDAFAWWSAAREARGPKRKTMLP